MIIQNREKAFSLAELSIVLIIIGLLLGGVTAGSKLIGQTKLKSVISDNADILTAIRTFQMSYDSLPGDMIDAKSFWSSCTDVSGNNCNGDNNDKIDLSTLEDIRFWQHLSLSEIYPGNFTGIVSGTRYGIGINIPSSPFQGGGYGAFNASTFGKTDNLVMLGKINAAGYTSDGLLTPTDVKHIEDKVDDGLASRGNMHIIRGNEVLAESKCVDQNHTTYTAADVNFILTDKTASCIIIQWVH